MNKVVVRFADGRLVKGTTKDFLPAKPMFHVVDPDAPPGTEPRTITVSELKAVFFVKEFAGDPGYREKKEFEAEQRPLGRPIRVVFRDGEVLVGVTQGYQPGRPGFFVEPADPNSNNERCYVVTAATTEVGFI